MSAPAKPCASIGHGVKSRFPWTYQEKQVDDAGDVNRDQNFGQFTLQDWERNCMFLLSHKPKNDISLTLSSPEVESAHG